MQLEKRLLQASAVIVLSKEVCGWGGKLDDYLTMRKEIKKNYRKQIQGLKISEAVF